MSAVIPIHADIEPVAKICKATVGDTPTILTDIYREDTNIAVWRRQLSPALTQFIEGFLNFNNDVQIAMTVTRENAFTSIKESLGINNDEATEFCQDITGLVSMFCDLFDTKHVGLRLRTLDRAMCPRFHVDRVPCRLVTTYSGVATQWLADDSVDRSKLGRGNNGLPDDQSGIYSDKNAIQQLHCGDVGLLKGEAWHDNENGGLVHRSPQVAANENRLLMTLDFID